MHQVSRRAIVMVDRDLSVEHENLGALRVGCDNKARSQVDKLSLNRFYSKPDSLRRDNELDLSLVQRSMLIAVQRDFQRSGRDDMDPGFAIRQFDQSLRHGQLLTGEQLGTFRDGFLSNLALAFDTYHSGDALPELNVALVRCAKPAKRTEDQRSGDGAQGQPQGNPSPGDSRNRHAVFGRGWRLVGHKLPLRVNRRKRP